MNALEKRISQVTIAPILRAQNSRLHSLVRILECEESAPEHAQYAYQRYNELSKSRSSLEEALAS
jgi:hypothetical protein